MLNKKQQTADPRKGPGGPCFRLIFRPNWDPEGPKKFFGALPLSKGLDDCPPIITRSGSSTEHYKPPQGLQHPTTIIYKITEIVRVI